uniref:DnaJ subfamily C member 11 n=1 Tax=Lygus hesperus TaxID=30085 RepID=A0A0A9VTB9_LYGHE
MINTSEQVGECIDVTNVIQCMVDNSALIIHDGGSKAWLEGFYDPNDNKVSNLLYVRYKFLNRLHEVIVEDHEELCLPLEEHVLSDDEQDTLSLLETIDTDISSDINPDDETAVQDAIQRAKDRRFEKNRLRKCLRSVRRVRPRAQLYHEISNIKVARRRNLYLSLGLFFISITTYYSHQWQIIDFFKLPLIRVLANFIGLQPPSVPSLTCSISPS